jgi:hypothetical protein
MNRGDRKLIVTVTLIVLAIVTALLIDVVTGTSGGASEPSHSTKTKTASPGIASPATPAPVTGAGVTFRTVGANVNLRASASTNAAIVATLGALGSPVTLSCYTRGATIGNDPWWYRATTGGARGYVSGFWVNTGPDPVQSRLPAC